MLTDMRNIGLIGIGNRPNVGRQRTLYAQLDEARRSQGRLLDGLGLGPIETRSRVVLTTPLVTLKAYGDPHPGPVVLIVPAPIKRAYLWDLVPKASAVQRLLHSGAQVYLIQWERPGADAQHMGLAAYADESLQRCLDAITAEVGQPRAFLAGHSLGGTFAAIFAALHSNRVQGLVLLGAPLHFGVDAGAFRPLISAGPPARVIGSILGNVPGSFLNVISVWASPKTFVVDRWTDWLTSFPNAEARHLHLLVERWTLDEMPLPRRLFEDIVERLYREDRFMRGTLVIRGRRAAPELVSAPILNVVEAGSDIVPPESVLPFHKAVHSRDRQLLWYQGDTGVALQHVGMLVGKRAHQNLWPRILSWIHAHSEAENKDRRSS